MSTHRLLVTFIKYPFTIIKRVNYPPKSSIIHRGDATVMQHKSFYAVFIMLMMLAGSSKAELFRQYHHTAFSGFGIQSPVFNLKKLGPIKQGSFNKKLWSDDYWPIYTGGLAFRYADPGFWLDISKRKSTDWKIPGEHVLKKHPAAQLIRSGLTNNLSPAEKYDLLVGDVRSPNEKTQPGYTLTRSHIKELTKKTQLWEGTCDGWSFAAINEAPPVKAVTVKNQAGVPITFYPSDIRALLTLLYSDYNVYSFGQLCREKKPELEPAHARSAGRALNARCRGLNPGLFHTVLINQMGIGKRSLVVDSDYTSEVWNVPVMSYQAEYYNPATGESFNDAFSARVARTTYTSDANWYHRNPEKVSFIVGVILKIKYQVENFPLPKVRLHPNHDKAFNDVLTYDLELDQAGNIIGGEWTGHSRTNHPDIISYVSTSDVIRSPFDRSIRGDNLPEILRSLKPEYIARTSANKRPLFKVVKALARMSQ